MSRLYGRKFETRRQAMDEVVDWLTFYNHKRLHFALGYVSPMPFKKSWHGAQLLKSHNSTAKEAFNRDKFGTQRTQEFRKNRKRSHGANGNIFATFPTFCIQSAFGCFELAFTAPYAASQPLACSAQTAGPTSPPPKPAPHRPDCQTAGPSRSRSRQSQTRSGPSPNLPPAPR